MSYMHLNNNAMAESIELGAIRLRTWTWELELSKNQKLVQQAQLRNWPGLHPSLQNCLILLQKL